MVGEKKIYENAPSGNRTRVSTLEVSYSTSELSAQSVRRVGVEPTRFRIGFLKILRPTP